MNQTPTKKAKIAASLRTRYDNQSCVDCHTQTVSQWTLFIIV